LNADDHDRLTAICPVQYNRPFSSVYLDATISVLVTHPSKFVHLFQTFRPLNTSVLGSPTWVIDFSAPLFNESLLFDNTASSPNLERSLTISSNKQMLSIDGHSIGLVEEAITNRLPVWDWNAEVSVPWRWHLSLESRYTSFWQRTDQWRRLMKTQWYIMDGIASDLFAIDCAAKKFLQAHDAAQAVYTMLLYRMVTDRYMNNTFRSGNAQLDYEWVVYVGSLPRWLQSACCLCLGASLVYPLLGRSFFFGTDGCYGLADGHVRKGDQLVLLFPGQWAPFILRQREEKYEIVGVAHLPDHLLQKATASVQCRSPVRFNIV
jgi:hypothetical protein